MTNDFTIETATKDELLTYAKDELGKELNGRDKVENLRGQVKQFIADTLIDNALHNVQEMALDAAEAQDAGEQDYRYALNLHNGRIVIASEGVKRLVRKGELVACDKNGQRL